MPPLLDAIFAYFADDFRHAAAATAISLIAAPRLPAI